MSSNKALVLFSHGSLLCGSGALLDGHAEQLRKSGRYISVEPGYLNYSKPPVEDAVRLCVEAGADTVIVVPYFLVAGKFVVEDLPRRMDSIVGQFPQIRFIMARALEDSTIIQNAVEQVLLTVQETAKWQRDAIHKARLLCELRSNCPLFGSAMCRTDSQPNNQ